MAPPKPGDPLPNLCGVMMIEVRGSTMTQFAQRLSGRVDRTVVDKTGITGKFNFHLEFTPDPNMPGQSMPAGRGGDPGNAANASNPAPPPDSGPNLFAARQEQIGLKLLSDRGPVSFLIIDHVEKPTAN
ncbi:MAG TPA: TIGR03435 family protein [Bryobacteraceae bacterium]|nr:TIGR03435 family protein [Bryobacteraceae bacterium]